MTWLVERPRQKGRLLSDAWADAGRSRLVALCDALPVAFYDLHRCAVAWGRSSPGRVIVFGKLRRATWPGWLIIPNFKTRQFDVVAQIEAPLGLGDTSVTFSPLSFNLSN